MKDLFGNPIEIHRDIDNSFKPCSFRQWQLREGERIYNVGVSSLSNEEILAHLLRDKQSASRLLEHFRTMQQLAEAHIHELMQVTGIGKAQAEKIVAAFELSKRINNCCTIPKPSMDSCQKVYEYISPQYQNLKQEVLKVLLLDAKSHLITTETVFIGTLNSSICHPREIYKTAIKLSAAAIIICHNHPSGVPQASIDDRRITQQLVDAGNIIDIKLLDHLIIGDEGYFSMKEEGII
jgi:DNA repair protein RadC